MSTEIIEQYSKGFTMPYKRKRYACRAIITEGDKILLVHESRLGFYSSPGGTMEENEAPEECVVREILEETGYIAEPLEHSYTVHEYCCETFYTIHYFICKITGKGECSLTQVEADKGLVPVWVSLDEALKIFSDYETKTPDKESLYRRETTIIKKLIK